MSTNAGEASAAGAPFRSMRNDALLPPDLTPDGHPAAADSGVLVTGATGFLGRYVVRELVRRSPAPIYCLVRASGDAAARERLARALESVDIDWTAHAHRIHVRAGAIDRPRLGLTARAYCVLAGRIGLIYHCAATVNWALSYRRLRDSNTLGTLELIRFACSGVRKRVCFSSTIAVAFAAAGPDRVLEGTDMLPYVAQMPLGYAQTKCVAEGLLRAAAARGVPVTIVRPALISGDTQTGSGNRHDLMCALIQGCVHAGAAPDCDWQLDCVPVDYVARVLARLGETERPHWEVLNLFNEQGRQWREIVLWMNLYGYPVQLVAHAEWLSRAVARGTGAPSLFAYRRFLGAGRRDRAPAPYETYLETAQRRVCNEETREVLRALDVGMPALDAGLMERYFDYYVAAGILPAARPRRRATGRASGDAQCILRRAMEGALAARGLEFVDARERPFASTHGIFNEVAAARVGGPIGIRRYEVRVNGPNRAQFRSLDVLLKSKPADRVMQDLLVEIATLCEPALGAQCRAFSGDLGLTDCHERELALFEMSESRLRRLMPQSFGTHRDLTAGTWSAAMEYLPDAEAVDAASVSGSWGLHPFDAVVHGLAQLHAIWYENVAPLRALPWLAAPLTAARMIEMTPLWMELAEHSDRFFGASPEEPILPLQKRFIRDLGEWWPMLRGLPHGLVHNDFNPRNLVLRNNGGGSALRVLDWELAGVGVPQHDLAELLCFALPRPCDHRTLSDILQAHRHALQTAAGVSIDAAQWLLGFDLSLRHLLINRLPLYTLIHRFKRQAFLPQLIRNWRRLYQLCGDLRVRASPESFGESGNYQHHRSAKQILRPYP